MEPPKRRSRKPFIITISIIIGVVVAALVFIGIQFFTKTGIFKIPGVVYYDEASLSDEELSTLKNIFTEEIELDKDVYISAFNTLEKPEITEGQFLTEIYVPVTNFYSVETSISSEEAYALESDLSAVDGIKLIKLEELDNKQKLLAINDEYYLDNFENGAVFRVITFASENYEKEIAPLVATTFAKTFPTKDSVLTFAQTGVTALSRGMNEKLNKVGDATYFSAKIRDYLSSFDITHTSNESSFSSYATSRNICSDERFIDTLLDIGLDVVELTGNHNQDCGDEAALNTIDTYINNGIKIVGGGKTAAEAAKPLEIQQKNTNITFLAYNQSTGGATYDDTPGANQYYEDEAAKDIATAKERGDFVIVDVQYYECAAYASEYEDPICDYADSAAGDQIGFFRHLIDLGADIVVGTSAHQPQTFERYGNGAIYYGLGNLFFDQVWWPGTTRSLILSHYFYNGKLLQTKIVPTVYDKNMQTELMDADTAKWFIERLEDARPEPAVVGLQEIVNNWAKSVGGEKSVYIYDLDNSDILASYNADKNYNTASLYKLFVAYEGYRRIERGEWAANESLGSTGHTYGECLDLAIRESHSPCAETLWAKIGANELDQIIATDFQITNSDISSLVSNVKDIKKIMTLFFTHKEFSSETWSKIQDSMLNQPVTTYDWRRGLPSGFTENAKVYNKVGWAFNGKDWDLYHDAAIIEFPEKNRHLIVVVMTKHVDNKDIARLGTEIENYIMNN